MSARSAILATLLVAAFASTVGRPVPAHATQTPDGRTGVRTTIRGRENPELVPDAHAARLVLLTLARIPDDRARARLVQIGFRRGDLALLQYELARLGRVEREFQYQMATAQQVEPQTDESREQFLEAWQARDAAPLHVYSSLLAGLSPGGVAALRAYIDREKANMQGWGVARGPEAPPATSPTAPPGGPPRFQAAHVAPSTGASGGVGLAPHPDGWVRIHGTTLRQLIQMAADLSLSRLSGSPRPNALLVGSVRDGVHVPPLQIVGGPRWLDNDRFDLEGYAGTGRRIDEVREMLHALLQERFQLVARFGRQPMEVLALVRDPQLAPGRWLQKAQPDGTLPPPLVGGCPRYVSPGRMPDLPDPPPGEPDWRLCGANHSQRANGSARITLGAVPVFHLADGLTRITGRTVLDRTGLDGLYYAHVEFWWPLPGARAAAPASRLEPAAAVELQLGLALRQIEVDADVLTIERIERPQMGPRRR